MSDQKITGAKMLNALDFAYDKAINGVIKQKSAIELANEYLSSNNHNVEEAINDLVKVQTLKCGTSGFVSGLGGLITLPVAVPANVTHVFYNQLRMIAAIAHLRGHDVSSDKARTFAYMCLTGESAYEIAKRFGIVLGNKVATNLVKKIPGKVLIEINKKVGFRLATKFGSKGLINLGKVVPVVGGIIGMGMDAQSTKTIGKITRDAFPKLEQVQMA